MASFSFLVVSIFIGVLITRIIVAWAFAIRTYAESKIFLDPHQTETDWLLFKQRVMTAFLATLLSLFFILIALFWYRDYSMDGVSEG